MTSLTLALKFAASVLFAIFSAISIMGLISPTASESLTPYLFTSILAATVFDSSSRNPV
jgi:hypothetical protein